MTGAEVDEQINRIAQHHPTNYIDQRVWTNGLAGYENDRVHQAITDLLDTGTAPTISEICKQVRMNRTAPARQAARAALAGTPRRDI